MPASTTTTPKPKTYTFATIEAACEVAKEQVLTNLGPSVFHDAADLTCKLFTKYLKEALK